MKRQLTFIALAALAAGTAMAEKVATSATLPAIKAARGARRLAEAVATSRAACRRASCSDMSSTPFPGDSHSNEECAHPASYRARVDFFGHPDAEFMI